jgi:hypothetical protein
LILFGPGDKIEFEDATILVGLVVLAPGGVSAKPDCQHL